MAELQVSAYVYAAEPANESDSATDRLSWQFRKSGGRFCQRKISVPRERCDSEDSFVKIKSRRSARFSLSFAIFCDVGNLMVVKIVLSLPSCTLLSVFENLVDEGYP